MRKLDGKESSRFQSLRGDCNLLNARVESVGDFLTIVKSLPLDHAPYWFRGNASMSWNLTPSALRHRTDKARSKALQLLAQFKRVVETKLQNPPQQHEELKWVQTARHYGLPTRLLDWTQNAAIGLYFACLPAAGREDERDGAVFMFNPIDLNRQVDSKRPRVFNAVEDGDIIEPYLKLSGAIGRKTMPTIAVEPVWDSERILLQRGVFTLHGSKMFTLGKLEAPSLVFVPVLERFKSDILCELQRIGIDEMSIFPEPEHVCSQLIRQASL